MSGRKKLTDFQESEYAQDLVKIMAAGEGPFTRGMLTKELAKLYPHFYKQDLNSVVSGALLMDRLSKKYRFKLARRGWYDLNK